MSTTRNHFPKRSRWAAPIVLAAAAAIALAATITQLIYAPLGVAITVLGGIAALWITAREAKQSLAQSRDQGREAVRRESAARSSERAESQQVLQVMTRHNDDLAATNGQLNDQRRRTQQEIVGLKRRIGTLQTDLSTVRGDNAVLQTKLEDQRAELSELRDLVVAKELQLAELRGEEPEASVLQIARAGRRDDDGLAEWTATGSVDEDDHPTVANMAALKAAESERAARAELPRARQA